MSATSLTQVLPTLENELFFAILDVALDLDRELLAGDDLQVFIPLRRLAIRFPTLCPINNPGAIERYCQLRFTAGKLLTKHGFIGPVNYHQQGAAHGWDGVLEVTVLDPIRFEALLVELKIEENRRNPGQKMEADIHSAVARLVQLVDSFHRVILRLRDRRTGREPIQIKDEYDVQYVFAALLETRFEDIRPEVYGPPYAGGATRVDFLLKNESVLIETKMTRAGLTDHKLGDELLIDIAHYKQMPDCKALVCFVYDPDHSLKNPQGLENDLSKPSDHLDVRVLIRPKS